eukprot:2361677-Rhodomonas_salina.1
MSKHAYVADDLVLFKYCNEDLYSEIEWRSAWKGGPPWFGCLIAKTPGITAALEKRVVVRKTFAADHPLNKFGLDIIAPFWPGISGHKVLSLEGDPLFARPRTGTAGQASVWEQMLISVRGKFLPPFP